MRVHIYRSEEIPVRSVTFENILVGLTYKKRVAKMKANCKLAGRSKRKERPFLKRMKESVKLLCERKYYKIIFFILISLCKTMLLFLCCMII